MKFLCIVLMATSLFGCNTQPVAAPSLTHNVESTVIVIPGYYGTRLVKETDGNLIFISLTQALFGDQTLTLPVPHLGFKRTLKLIPDGILEEVSVIPLIYAIDGYGSLLEQLHLSSNEHRDIIPFPYDWRGDLIDAVRSLDALIHRLKAEGKNNISVVAHSMGGLIVSYYLRYGIQDIDSAVETWKGAQSLKSVVMAGVPFLGTMHSLRNMNFGITVGLNSSLLTSEAYASFPASYYTLPIADADELFTPEGQSVKGMIRKAGQWQQSGWGLLNTNQRFDQKIIERRADYTSFWLDRSQRFLKLIRALPTTPIPKQASLLYIYGKGTPTLSKGMWKGSQTKGQDSLAFADSAPAKSSSINNPPTIYTDGDGTITVASALLPPAYIQSLQTTIREYQIGHTDLVSSTDIQDDIVAFLKRDKGPPMK